MSVGDEGGEEFPLHEDAGSLMFIYDRKSGEFIRKGVASEILTVSQNASLGWTYLPVNISMKSTHRIVFDPDVEEWKYEELRVGEGRPFVWHFLKSDWVQYTSYYFISIPGELHLSGSTPIVIVYKKNADGSYVQDKTTATITIREIDRVVLTASSTFEGRVAIGKLST
jgi:hypothetical protein